MSNRRVAIVVVVVVVLVAACIMAVAPTLMDAIRGIHVIPPH